jgi:cytosine/adenosine deaminase-related metal-dependent hydrolase
MTKDKSSSHSHPQHDDQDRSNDPPTAPGILKVSRRDLMAGVAAGSVTAAGLGFNTRSAKAHDDDDDDNHRHHKKKDRVVLEGGIVLTMEGANKDYEKADILIENGKIKAIGRNLNASGKKIDCRGLILCPGFITTHHHQYETVQRSIIADGILARVGDPEMPPNTWPHEEYSTVVQGIWTAGRLSGPSGVIWDLGTWPQQPEDLYIAELVASLAQITQGVTCSTDTSQASHTPEHTDAMVKGLIDSGARAVFDYSTGTPRAAIGDVSRTGYEFPGAIGDETFGVGRLKKKFFSSDDQLVTLALGANQAPVLNRKTGATESYSGWELARNFSCWINNHGTGSGAVINNPGRNLLNNPDIAEHLTLVHATLWDFDQPPVVQTGANGAGGVKTGYPNPSTSQAWQIAADTGVHISVACPLEQQMRHSLPPIQMALNYGIMPSLSPDVDTNMTGDPFTLMRGAFNLQRGLANELAFPRTDPGGLVAPQLLTCYQAMEMATHAGAVGSGLGNKVGLLKVGYDADIVFLETNSIDIAPMHNAPGSVVTMMDTSHVRHVMIAGEFKYWNYKLVGWNVDKLVRDIIRSKDRMLERIRRVPLPVPGNNTKINPYTPPLLGSCCYVGQNAIAPHYVLRK